MKIIGFNLDKIEAAKKKPATGKISLNAGIDIKDISSAKINISDSPSLKFDFQFNLIFEPEMASIILSGTIITLADKEEEKSILEEWKNKKFTHKSKLGLFNFIMEKCTFKALQLEEDLGIPFHIPFPKLKAQKSDSKETNPANYAG